MIEITRVIANMRAEDVRHEADVNPCEPNLVETAKKLRDMISPWMLGMPGDLSYRFKHINFKNIMLATVAV